MEKYLQIIWSLNFLFCKKILSKFFITITPGYYSYGMFVYTAINAGINTCASKMAHAPFSIQPDIVILAQNNQEVFVLRLTIRQKIMETKLFSFFINFVFI